MKKQIFSSVLAAFGLVVGVSGASAQDLAHGEQVYKKCGVCHSLDAGKKKVGPSLNGVIGRAAGTLEGFKYSAAMTASGITWDEATIDAYIADPKGYIPKNKMAFPGLKAEADRKDVIAYIASIPKQ